MHVGVPWIRRDPDWVYSDPRSLLAQGLQRSQEKTTTRQDPRLVATETGLVDRAFNAPSGRKALPAAKRAVWRWAPEFRAKAVMAELASRVLVAPAIAPKKSGTGVGLYRLEYDKTEKQFLFVSSLGIIVPGDYDWNQQCDKVLRAAIEREDRMPEIISQCEDVWSYFHAAAGLVPGTAPHLAELMQTAWGWAELAVMALKHHMQVLRPFQRNSLILPVIETPGHGSLPSGHATMAAMTAQLFIDVLDLKPDSPRALALNRLARRIAFNRVVAGVHFQVDSVVGYTLGKHLACLLKAWGQGGNVPASCALQVAPADTLSESLDAKHEPELSRIKGVTLPIWGALWTAAQLEFVERSLP